MRRYWEAMNRRERYYVMVATTVMILSSVMMVAFGVML